MLTHPLYVVFFNIQLQNPFISIVFHIYEVFRHTYANFVINNFEFDN